MTAFLPPGKAYLAFARAEPRLLRRDRFEAAIPLNTNSGAAGARTPRLRGGLRAGLRGGLRAPPEGEPAAGADDKRCNVWSLSTAVASLFARGDGAPRSLPMSRGSAGGGRPSLYLQGVGSPAAARCR